MSKLKTIKIIVLALFFILFAFTTQQNSNPDFSVYLQENRYDAAVSHMVSTSSNFQYYKYLGEYYIDRERKGIIDYKYVDQGIANLFPQQDQSGFLCLNIENSIYQNLKKYNPGQIQFDKSEKQLIDFIKYVKHQRVNIKVGIYGLPSNFYWKNIDEKYPNKFDKLLKEVDYISPHLYIHYSENQYGLQNNIKYIRQNLAVSLDYGLRLNKPVIPYVWYLIHPSNKKFGKELIPQDEMVNYLKTISTYEFNNRKVKGIIWWEPSKLDYKTQQGFKAHSKSKYTINDIALEYLSFLVDLKK